MLTLILFALSGSCDSLSSEMYRIENSFTQIRKCMCIRRAELDGFKCLSAPVLKAASKCPDIEQRVDSLRLQIKRVRKELR